MNVPGGTAVNSKTTTYQKQGDQEKEDTKEQKENTKENTKERKVNIKDQTDQHRTQEQAMNHQRTNQKQQTIQDGNHIDQHQKEVILQTQKAQAKEKAKAQEE